MAPDLKILLMPLILVVFLNIVFGHSTYAINKTCGELNCKLYEYCSNQELTCRPCQSICDKDSHNYNEVRCQRDCMDYIHDVQIGYARKSDIQSLIDEVNKIRALVVVILILVVVLVTIIAGMVAKVLYRYRKQVNLRKLEQKKFEQKLSSVQYTISNNNSKSEETIGAISHSLRTTMPSTMTLTTQTEGSPPSTNKSISTTKTLPLSVEEPSEDTTLDYAAYVNQALSHSPPNEVHLCPTKLDMA